MALHFSSDDIKALLDARNERISSALRGTLVGHPVPDESRLGDPQPCPNCGQMPVHDDGWLPGEYLTHLRKDHP